MKPTDLLAIEIDVTQSCIDHGNPSESDSCPIAIAIFRMSNEELFADVGDHCVVITDKTSDDLNVYDLPPEACDFISNFDRMKEVKPFKFKLLQSVKFCESDR